MNATVAPERQALNSFDAPEPRLPVIYSMAESDAIDTLTSSFYPGAKRESVKAVLSYCRAARLDPVQRPVHIVPMNVKTGERDADGDVYEWRDIVLPGIGLYRTQAASTGLYAGQDEPEFGPLQTLTYEKKFTVWNTNERGKRYKSDEWRQVSIQYPEWCRVTVYRFVQGVRCAFVARELWLENYGTASAWTDAPNKMWEKRIHGQLAKCAEAQALRKGFPEAVGSGPTADEMEGKRYDFDLDESGNTTDASATPPPPPEMPPRKAAVEPAATGTMPAPAAAPAEQGPAPAPQPTQPQPGVFMATGGEKQNIVVRCRNAKRAHADVLDAVLGQGHGVNPDTFDGLTKEQFKQLRAALS
ncbi:MAG TPA: phage recombination protein Bet [Roseateles sp.]|uniref:phage recombination protein Bet n=1 Tax=Roseateles sp. TaxID=1971397 RepID=UPI002EDA4BC1